MGSQGKTFGLVPYGFREPSPERAGNRLWNERDGRFLAPVVFGVGQTPNLGSLPRHPFRALLLAAAVVLWRRRAGRKG